MRYELVRVEASTLLGQSSFISPDGEDYYPVLNDMAAKGWRYAGWIPVAQNGRGQIMSLDLVFERED